MTDKPVTINSLNYFAYESLECYDHLSFPFASNVPTHVLTFINDVLHSCGHRYYKGIADPDCKVVVGIKFGSAAALDKSPHTDAYLTNDALYFRLSRADVGLERRASGLRYIRDKRLIHILQKASEIYYDLVKDAVRAYNTAQGNAK